jgi:hypothetical protein
MADRDTLSLAAAVRAALAGEPGQVTAGSRAIGTARLISGNELARDMPTQEQVIALEAKLQEFERGHPEATAEEFADHVVEQGRALGLKHLADYGPVPASRVEAEAGRILSALEGGRRVMIAQAGRVVAVIDPVPLAGPSARPAARGLD